MTTEPPTLDGVLAGDARALGRAITLAGRGEASGMQIVEAARARAGRAFRVGVTGPSGAGKSSLLREIIRRLRPAGDRVALVASDPVSPASGGAMLGDRCRLASLAQDPGVFIRSIAHRGPPGEPSPAALRAADILDAGGFEWVFLESVGAGQAEVGALRGADLKILVHSPDGGDHVQMLKAGLMETADIHVVNKADRPGAPAWAGELVEALAPLPGSAGKAVPVLLASAVTGEGVDVLVETLRARRQERRRKQ